MNYCDHVSLQVWLCWMVHLVQTLTTSLISVRQKRKISQKNSVTQVRINCRMHVLYMCAYKSVYPYSHFTDVCVYLRVEMLECVSG